MEPLRPIGKTGAADDEGDSQRQQHELSQLVIAAKKVISSISAEDPERDGLVDTPHRFAEAFAGCTDGYSKTAEEVIRGAIFLDDFHHQTNNSGMVIVRDIQIYSLCEHHMLPFFGKAHIAYVPNPKVGVLGLSKFNRIAEVYARRLQVQERLTEQIMDAIDRNLQPSGVAVILECRHMCMEMRGVKSGGTTITLTKSVCGAFRTDHDMLSEFLTMALTGRHEANGLDVKNCSCCRQQISNNRDDMTSTDQEMNNHIILENKATESPVPSKLEVSKSDEADNYRLYLSCAKDETSKIVGIIEEAVTGPISERETGYRILDIGAGNGHLLAALCANEESFVSRITRYEAYEEDEKLCAELRTIASKLRLDAHIRCEHFSIESPPVAGGRGADLVLLSHSLYGAASKEDTVTNALEQVAPGGILLVIHRWVPGGCLDSLSDWLASKLILHDIRILDVKLDLSHLGAHERVRLSKYTKGDVDGMGQSNCVSAIRKIGYIAIEAQMSSLHDRDAVNQAIEDAREQVGYWARKKDPYAVISPNTSVGVQSCLRAASQGLVDCAGVTVIGGGHSCNCLADDALVVHLQKWNHVVVNPDDLSVRVGGGATIGAITRECEKFGLAVPLGDRPSVGVGLILQGGLNHFMRAFGLACDTIIQVRYVSPKGRLCVAAGEEQLFPFRGAGPNFGVVLELTLRTTTLSSVRAQDTEYLLDDPSGFQQVATSYSQVATGLANKDCLDGFIFWSSHEQMCFATSHYCIEDSSSRDSNDHHQLLVPLETSSTIRIISSEPSYQKPSELFDRELYMTALFDPIRVVPDGSPRPAKLLSGKRCLLLQALAPIHGSIFFNSIRNAPTKWCYVHFLHGGGAVSRIKPSETAFGCRSWSFAAVITARWPKGDVALETLSVAWLERTTKELLPHADGVYAADLCPDDGQLASRAFGGNVPRLASLKRRKDPMNILRCGCPLLGESTSTTPCMLQGGGVVVLLCGRRTSGKDWLARELKRTLTTLLGEEDDTEVAISRISDTTKQAYAEENPGINAKKLIHDRHYKETHRPGLSAFYAAKKVQDWAFGEQCYVDTIDNATASILLVTGMRDGLACARSLSGSRKVLLVKVNASDNARKARGWLLNPSIDQSAGECAADFMPEDFWDLCYDNDLNSNAISAEEWTKRELAPLLLKRCTRNLPDDPGPGIMYRDLVGGLLLQPFAVSLCTSLFVDRLMGSSNANSIDAVISPEALGFVFAGSVAERLNKPLVLARKGEKLPGDVNRVSYDGSNVANLSAVREAGDQCSLAVVAGSIHPGERFLVVDDCLASGATIAALSGLVEQQGGKVCMAACVMEFPDLLGRQKVRINSIDFCTLIQFSGS